MYVCGWTSMPDSGLKCAEHQGQDEKEGEGKREESESVG